MLAKKLVNDPDDIVEEMIEGALAATPDALDATSLKAALGRVDETMRARRDEHCELDGVIGDADHGVTMVTGFRAVRAALDTLDVDGTGAGAATPGVVLGVAARGKAEPGDKTMLDAWRPAAEAADAGARQTIGLQARKGGRAARLGERSIGHMDAGAASTALLLHALAGSGTAAPDAPRSGASRPDGSR